jgi:hypothetical protein
VKARYGEDAVLDEDSSSSESEDEEAEVHFICFCHEESFY